MISDLKLVRWNLKQADFTPVDTEEGLLDLIKSGYDDRVALVKLLEDGGVACSEKFEYRRAT